MPGAKRKTYKVPFRRRREGRTNYSKRLALVKFGERMVVRKSDRYITVQFVSFSNKGDIVVSAASSREFLNHKVPALNNLPIAYLTGYLAAKRAISKGIKKATLDTGLRTPHSRSFAMAALKGALDAGLEIPHNEEELSKDNGRFMGSHIAEYAKMLKEKDENRYKKIFSAYLSAGLDPCAIPDIINKLKSKLEV
ncbi:MAG: 50S ribosomal protein L18 [Candidatus Micrarchaeia archaeon]